MINQHLGLHQNVESSIQALKMPRMNFTDRVWWPNISINIEVSCTRFYCNFLLSRAESTTQYKKIILRQMLGVLMYQWNFHPTIAHGTDRNDELHISAQNEAQSVVWGNSVVPQHFIVITQHMGCTKMQSSQSRCEKRPKCTSLVSHCRVLWPNTSIKLFVVIESVQKIWMLTACLFCRY